ncbi:MAG: hypothetical protein IJZ39_08750 [Oscillospiraceae bacterium]|nr:hypothetical protein [Oscillospiraceae bacterium]
MKIRIKSEETNLNLVLPTRLLIGKTVVKLANTIGRRYAAEAMQAIPPEALEILCAELRRIKKKHGAWELVDVRCADGDIVQVIL